MTTITPYHLGEKMNNLVSAPVIPASWTHLNTGYGHGLGDADREDLQALLKYMASEKACLEIERFFIPDAPLADAVSLGALVRLTPEICVERSKWLIRHEVIHVLRTLQLLRASEWKILRSEAQKRGWLVRFSIAKRYKKLDDNVWIEEAVAEAFAAWCENNPANTSRTQALRNQTKIFWRSCVNFCAGRGFASAESIFYAISTGVVARRPNSQRRGPSCAQLASYILDSGPYLVAP